MFITVCPNFEKLFPNGETFFQKEKCFGSNQGATETKRAHSYYQEVWPKLTVAAGCKANSESVKFTNKRLDFCQIWLGEHKGPVRLSL